MYVATNWPLSLGRHTSSTDSTWRIWWSTTFLSTRLPSWDAAPTVLTVVLDVRFFNVLKSIYCFTSLGNDCEWVAVFLTNSLPETSRSYWDDVHWEGCHRRQEHHCRFWLSFSKLIAIAIDLTTFYFSQCRLPSSTAWPESSLPSAVSSAEEVCLPNLFSMSHIGWLIALFCSNTQNRIDLLLCVSG